VEEKKTEKCKGNCKCSSRGPALLDGEPDRAEVLETFGDLLECEPGAGLPAVKAEMDPEARIAVTYKGHVYKLKLDAVDKA